MDSLPFRDEPSSPSVGLGGIRVLNFREARTTVEITVLKDGHLVYERAHTLDGNEGNLVGSVEVVESWMGQKVPYEITVTARDPQVDATFSTSKAEQFVEDWGENNCFHVDFDINGETIRTALGGMNDCSSPSSDSTVRNDTTDLRS